MRCIPILETNTDGKQRADLLVLAVGDDPLTAYQVARYWNPRSIVLAYAPSDKRFAQRVVVSLTNDLPDSKIKELRFDPEKTSSESTVLASIAPEVKEMRRSKRTNPMLIVDVSSGANLLLASMIVSGVRSDPNNRNLNISYLDRKHTRMKFMTPAGLIRDGSSFLSRPGGLTSLVSIPSLLRLQDIDSREPSGRTLWNSEIVSDLLIAYLCTDETDWRNSIPHEMVKTPFVDSKQMNADSVIPMTIAAMHVPKLRPKRGAAGVFSKMVGKKGQLATPDEQPRIRDALAAVFPDIEPSKRLAKRWFRWLGQYWYQVYWHRWLSAFLEDNAERCPTATLSFVPPGSERETSIDMILVAPKAVIGISASPVRGFRRARSRMADLMVRTRKLAGHLSRYLLITMLETDERLGLEEKLMEIRDFRGRIFIAGKDDISMLDEMRGNKELDKLIPLRSLRLETWLSEVLDDEHECEE